MPLSDPVETLLRRGAAAFESGDLALAEQEFRRAAAINPASPEVHFNLGMVYRALGRPLDALSHFREVVLLDPEDAEAYHLLGASAIDVGMLPEAEEFLLEAARLAPQGATALPPLRDLADLYIRTGRPDDARPLAERISSLERLRGPDDNTASTPPEQACSPGPSDSSPGLDRPSGVRSEDADHGHTLPQVSDASVFSKGDTRLPQGHRRLKTGFVTVWHERGQAYVTRTLRDAFRRNHDTFILARANRFDGRDRLETSGEWADPNLTVHPDYDIPPDALRNWIAGNRLDVVVFNEEYDWQLVRACKETGVRTYTYLDYYEDSWKPLLSIYDRVLCSTRRTFSLIADCCEARYIGWGIDTDLFRPTAPDEKLYTFFHNAGWAGVNYRKMTPAVVVAFDAVSKAMCWSFSGHSAEHSGLPMQLSGDRTAGWDWSLLIHSQRRLGEYPPEMAVAVRRNERITFHEGALPHPGLYHQAQIYVYPSKLDGLGLTLLESLACGLPAIVADAPPMNEFVRDGENGLLVRVATTMKRTDGIAFPEAVIDLNDLALKMAFLASSPDLVARLGENARRRIEEEHSLNRWRQVLEAAVSDE